MNARTLLIFSVIGLALVYFFAPGNEYKKVSAAELRSDCTGAVEIEAYLARTFYSQKGSYIGVLDGEILVLLKNESAIGGINITVRGKANIYRGQCWVFADEVAL